MAKDMLTRCPHCEQAFKVSEQQLTVANGRVRCGACMSVFDAKEHQLSEANHHSHQEIEASEKVSDDFSVFAPEPSEDDSVNQSKTNFGEDFSDSFLELNHPEMSFTADSEDSKSDDDEQNEDWAEALIEDDDTPPSPSTDKQKSRKEPSLSFDDSDAFEFPGSTEANTTQNKKTSTFGHEAPISFYREDDLYTPASTLPKTIALFTTNIVLAVVLALIVGWFNYDKISHLPLATPTYQWICSLADCELPALSDLEEIKSHNLVVRTHPTTKNTLIIEAVLTNHAKFEQAFPDLNLLFSDINNKVVAERVINPHVYLSRDVLNWGKMPPDQPIHISLEIIDPGKTAVNYKIAFSHSEQS